MIATIISDAKKHYPVLLNELISIITPQYGGTFIDCTFGQGGYTKKILKFPDTKVIGIDRDIASSKKAKDIEQKFQNRFLFKNIKFSQINNLKLKNHNVKGVIFDLGYSYTQIKDPKKGLSYNSVGKLNMKMGLNEFSAKDVINKSKVFTNLESTLGDIDILIATSARFRNKNVKHINLEDLKKIDFGKKIGFLFGSESSGLSNKEIIYAN